ncbi:MAG: molybdopterin-dependent oxidoreductase [Chloroflexi bacterium]|nr:molybdopterin-dependent oxidoreductase [Chloroflexota bacterium]
MQTKPEIRQVPTFCHECYNTCPAIAEVDMGVVSRVVGNPKSPYTGGRLCPKGNGSLMRVYDPHRLKTPLKRTNPQKGIEVDPQWQEITWEEALDTIAERLKHQRAVNPHGLKMPSLDTTHLSLPACWAHAFGTPFVGTGSGGGGGAHCGNALHTLGTMIWDSYRDWPDWAYTRYAIFMGTGEGFEANRSIPEDARRVADARVRGMKMVVVDPRFTNAAAKADEWVPIRPGTDGALVLGMTNLLLNEYGIYDAPFLQRHTNAPYLVGADGHYVREEGTKRPLIRDTVDQCAKSYEDFNGEASTRAALLGDFAVNGVPCKPAFRLIKDHVRQYTLDLVEQLTTVPAATVRRLARELGEAAQIGSTIEIEGEQWPLRPAVIMYGRGTQGHTNATQTTAAIYVLEMALGLLGTPGGTHRSTSGGVQLKGTPVQKGPDGITFPKLNVHHPYAPPSWPPKNYDLKDFFPINMKAEPLHIVTGSDPARWGLPEEITIFAVNANPLLSVGDLERSAAYYRKAFVVLLDQYMNETAQFADIVLPSQMPLETHNLTNVKAGDTYVGLIYSPPAIEPMYEARGWIEVLIDLAERCGFLHGEGGLNYWINMMQQLPPPYALGLEDCYTPAEILERIAKRHIGEEGWRTLVSEGIYWRKLPAKERYMPYRPHRLPFYQELILGAGESLVATLKEIGAYDKLAGEIDFSHYTAVPTYKPARIHEASPDTSGFDLYAVNGKTVLFTFGRSAFNPWLMEVAEMLPGPLSVGIHEATAARKGIRDGQRIWVESEAGKVLGTAKCTKAVHPECLSIAGTLGHWCEHPVAKGKGTHFNSLLSVGLKNMDPVFTTYQGVACRVRVYPAEE